VLISRSVDEAAGLTDVLNWVLQTRLPTSKQRQAEEKPSDMVEHLG
jgi:hypothetical protein